MFFKEFSSELCFRITGVILSWGVVTTNPFGFCKIEEFFVEKEFSSELLGLLRDPLWGVFTTNPFGFCKIGGFFI